MPTVEERVDTLESLLGQFIVHHDVALRRLEAQVEKVDIQVERLEKEMREFKVEMREFKEEMRAFRDESEKDRKALHEEMREFKEEMRVFRDKMDRNIEEMKEESKRKNREWSNLAKKMGTIVEDLIAPALRPVLSKYFNCEVSMEGQRMFRRRNGEDYEIDAIAVCDDRVFMVEARSTPRFDDIKEIKEKSERFFEFFPEHKGKELVVIFGSITFPQNVIRQASKKRIYVLAWREWEYMDILNFEEVSKAKRR